MGTQDHLTQALLLFFKECLLDYSAVADDVYLIIYRGVNGCWPLFFYVDESCRYIFSSLLPVTVRQEKIGAVARYLHHANYALHVGGKFEFDEDAGEIRFTTVLDIADGDVTTCMLFALFDAHRVADLHLRQLLSIALFDAWPADSPRVRDDSTQQWLQQGDLLDLLNDIDVDSLFNDDSEREG